MKPIDMTVEVNGTRYFTVNRFAWATRRSATSVRFLMCYGNRIRRLKVRRFDGKPYIPYSELTEFPFTVSGRNSTEVYHYDEEGRQSERSVAALVDAPAPVIKHERSKNSVARKPKAAPEAQDLAEQSQGGKA